MHHAGHFHARRLQYLEKRLDNLQDRIQSIASESRHWEADWEKLVQRRKQFDTESDRLDDAARRHNQRLPPRDYEAEDKLAAEEAARIEAKQRARLDERQRNLEAYQKVKQEEQDEQILLASREPDDWEAEYGAQLEEDPGFIRPPGLIQQHARTDAPGAGSGPHVHLDDVHMHDSPASFPQPRPSEAQQDIQSSEHHENNAPEQPSETSNNSKLTLLASDLGSVQAAEASAHVAETHVPVVIGWDAPAKPAADTGSNGWATLETAKPAEKGELHHERPESCPLVQRIGLQQSASPG